MALPTTHKAVKWYPPSYEVRVETVPIPEIQHPDDAIVKVTLAGLCGSDLHIYRGDGGIKEPIICGHEFIGHVVSLGESFSETSAKNRPDLYRSLKIGDKVVSPFTSNCGECHVCRIGFTCRCPNGLLFGCPALPGGQAQYVRVPHAGGTLFSLDDANTWPKSLPAKDRKIADSSLLLLADILPTGIFAALQAIQHPKVAPMVTGKSWPDSFSASAAVGLAVEDTHLTFAIVGLGPVGLCATIALLDALVRRDLPFNIVAIDLSEDRQAKMQAIYSAMDESGRGNGNFTVASPDTAQKMVNEWTNNTGCSAVLEVVGHDSAITLAYALVRPFGVITSVGVHGAKPLTLTGGDMYNKNISLDFGRCPARAMFLPAFELLVRRQDVFGGVGEEASLVDKIVGLDEAVESYATFDKGLCGKVLFDPWR